LGSRGRWDDAEKEHPRLRGLGSFLTPRFGVRLFVLAAEARKATVRRFGPTTPKRARSLYDASVDPTEARKLNGSRVNQSQRAVVSVCSSVYFLRKNAFDYEFRKGPFGETKRRVLGHGRPSPLQREVGP
jgi:hypothetical protein